MPSIRLCIKLFAERKIRLHKHTHKWFSHFNARTKLPSIIADIKSNYLISTYPDLDGPQVAIINLWLYYPCQVLRLQVFSQAFTDR